MNIYSTFKVFAKNVSTAFRLFDGRSRILLFSCFVLLVGFFLLASSEVSAKKHSADAKVAKVENLIRLRKHELTQRIQDLEELQSEGLVTPQESNILKKELKEIEQFEFIIQNPFLSSYEGTLKEKLSSSLTRMKSEIEVKENLWQEGLISSKEINSLKEKASLYNHILSFLTDESRMPLFLLKNKGLSSKLILGRHYPIESGFGYRDDPLTENDGRKYRKQFHAGIDFPAWTGTPVRSPFPAKVVKVVNSRYSGGGRQVKLKHAEGFETAYKHLSKINVALGQVIPKGKVIGYVGQSGKRVTGPHLHFELHLNGIAVDPTKYFD